MKKFGKIIVFVMAFVTIFTSNARANNIVILLDPGHGGTKDSGALGGGLKETDVVWKIANMVKAALDKVSGITSVLSRTENEKPELSDRGKLAEKLAADLVISFHINSSNSSSARGSEVYVTRDTTEDRYNKYSSLMGNEILNNLEKIGIPKRGNVKTRTTEIGARYPDGTLADYYGIIQYPMMKGIPSILIEHCYISNEKDRNFINNDNSIAKIANADVQGILKYIDLFKKDNSNNKIAVGIKTLSFDDENKTIKGSVLYNEIINNKEVIAYPRIVLKSTDNKECVIGEVEKISQYEYSFVVNMSNVNLYKKYNLIAE